MFKNPWLWVGVLMAVLLGAFSFLFYTQYTASKGANGAASPSVSSSSLGTAGEAPSSHSILQKSSV